MRVKRILLTCIVMSAFCVAMMAQSSGGSGSAGSTGSSSTGSSTGMAGSGASTDQTATPQSDTSTMSSNSKSNSANNDEASGKSAKLKGCISQSAGMFMLMDKKHPSSVQLDPGSQDLTAHVGHKV